MSGTGGAGGAGGGQGGVTDAEILKLGIDATGVERGKQQAAEALGKIKQAALDGATAFDQWQKKLDAAGAASNRFAATNAALARSASLQDSLRAEEEKLRSIENARRASIAANRSMQELAAAQRVAAATMGDLGRSAGFTAREMQMLAPQLNDVFTQLSMGQGVMMTLMAQGPQIVQGFGGVGATFSRIVSAIGPMNIAVGASVAAFAALALMADSNQGAMTRLQNRLRAVTLDYRETARSIEENSRRISIASPGFGLGEIRDAQVAIRSAAPVGLRDQGSINLLTEDVKRFSRTIATDMKGATEQMQSLLRTPLKFFDDMAQRSFPGFNQSLRQVIENMVAAGDRVGAIRALREELERPTRGAEDPASELAKRWQNLGKRIEEMWDKMRPGLLEVGAKFVEWMLDVVDLANRAEAAIGRLADRLVNPRGGEAPRPAGPAPSMGGVSGDMQSIIERAASVSGLDPEFLARVHRAEGRRLADGSWAVSPVGARGPMQVMPGTFGDLQRQYPGLLGGRSIDDPEANTIAGALYMRQQVDAFTQGDPSRLGLALGAYNAGPRNARSWTGAMPPGVQAYASGILAPTDGRPEYNRTPITGPVNITAQVAAVEAGTAAPGTPGVATPAGAASGAAPTDAQREMLNRLLAMGTGREPLASSSVPSIRAGQLDTVRRQAEEALRLPGLTDDDKTTLAETIRKARQEWEQTLPAAEQFMRTLRQQTEAADDLDPAVAAVNGKLREFREFMRGRGETATATQEMQVQDLVLRQLSAQYRAASTQVERDIASQRSLAAAYGEGAAAVAQAEARERAVTEARKFAQEGTGRYTAMVEALTQRYRDLARAQSDAASARSAMQSRDQGAILGLEAATLGMPAGQRAGILASAREYQGILGRGGDPGSAASQEAIEAARTLAVQRTEVERLQASYGELANFADQAFGRIGSAITEAFAKGESKGVKFSNVLKAMQSEFAQFGLRLGVLNPAMNALFGTNRPTLGSVMGVMSGGAGYGPGYGPGLQGDAAMYAAAGVPGYKLPQAAQAAPGMMQYAGVAGQVGSLAVGGSGGIGGLLGGGGASTGGWLANTLNTPLYSMPSSIAGNAAANAGGAAAQGAGSATVTVGNALAGVAGLGFGAYGLYSGLQEGGPRGYANATAGAAGMAAGGATLLGGAAAGGIIAGVATVAPYIAAIAAVVAMMLPAKEVNPGAAAQIQVGSDGALYVGKVGGKHVDVGAFEANVQQQLNDMSKLLRGADIDVSSLRYDDNRNWVGTGPAANKLPQSVQDVIWNAREFLRSENPAIEQVLRSNKVTSFEQMVGGAEWVQGVYDPLMKYGETVSTYAERVKELTKTFQDAIEAARELGINETDLVRKRREALADLDRQRQIDLDAMRGGLDARRQTIGGKTLMATLTRFDLDAAGQRRALEDQLEELDMPGADVRRRLRQFDRLTRQERAAMIEDARRPLADQRVADRVAIMRMNGMDERAALVEFDYAAQQRREALRDQIRASSTERNAVGTPEARALILQLEERLAAERLQVLQQFHRDMISFDKAGYAAREAAAGNAAGVVSSLAGYTKSLALGSMSPLNAPQKLERADADFAEQARKAMGGDFRAISGIQGYADAYLSAARGMYGSGAGYARAFDRVVETLAKVGDLGADALTRAAFAAEMRTNTQALVEELRSLKAEVAALRADTRQAAARPARIAA